MASKTDKLFEYIKNVLNERGINIDDPSNILQHVNEFRAFIYGELVTLAKKWCSENGATDTGCSRILSNVKKALLARLPKITIEIYRSNVTTYKTGISMLDNLFYTSDYGPGIPVAGETSILYYGPYGTGKTLLAHLNAAAAVAAGYEAHYVDTEATFKRGLALRFLQRFGVDVSEARERFFIWRVTKTNELKEQLEQIRDSYTRGGVVVIDSLSSTVRREFVGREKFTDRSKALADIFRLQQELNTRKYVVVYTAQIYKIPDAGSEGRYELLPATVMYGGELLRHQPEWVIATYKIIHGKKIYILLVIDDAPKTTGTTAVLALDPNNILVDVPRNEAETILEKTKIGLFLVESTTEQSTQTSTEKQQTSTSKSRRSRRKK